MQESAEKIEGNITIEVDTHLRGMVIGSVTVTKSVRLEMHGTITGDLVAERGSIVRVHGRVSGAVLNKGSELEIHGTIGSLQEISNFSPARVLTGAVIGSRTY